MGKRLFISKSYCGLYHKLNIASANMVLVLIIMKLTLLMVLVELNHIFTYKNIFTNEQYMYKSQLDLDLKLAIADLDVQKLPQIGFLPDNLSFFCPNGINVHKINIDNKSYGYFGIRHKKTSNLNLIQQKKLYYKMVLQEQNIDAHKIQIIDLSGEDRAQQVFFLDNNNALWRYDVASYKLFLQNSNINNINYIIGSDIFNAITNDFDLKYTIYLHSREKNKKTNIAQDVVQLANPSGSTKNLNIVRNIITSKQAIAHFFLRSNYIIFLYEDLNIEPQVYKLNYTNKFAEHVFKSEIFAKKIDIKFNVYKKLLNNCHKELDINNYELLWDAKLNAHKINIINTACELKTYEFNLPNDRGILSFRANDY